MLMLKKEGHPEHCLIQLCYGLFTLHTLPYRLGVILGTLTGQHYVDEVLKPATCGARVPQIIGVFICT